MIYMTIPATIVGGPFIFEVRIVSGEGYRPEMKPGFLRWTLCQHS